MIDAELTALLREPVMMVFAARSAAGLPALGRALGARPSPGGETLDIFTPAAQWGEALSGLVPGAPLAFTFVQPADYRTFQLKGELVSIASAGPEDIAAADRYAAQVSQALAALGVQPQQMAHWLGRGDLMTLRLAPTMAFSQTPGPHAGERLPDRDA
ncbi:hypothetical protein ASE17_10085 [Phenylobacterium sp. Root77]|uniref:hypothetical protein n=1 Tax=unclassified Phenylobacterium TaxID=2640670 RepID=UPI0006F4D108|nr:MULTISPECIES: hypothetical protein [unclassified Phenylobacterium]KQW73273.1 hypothetical protein ASC73_02655 [Phenylobacterium sp. Root1277]KQW92493.1 hypothetical protein ASC79_13365 [Phenylobacterium sp. Root1290]KRC40722.1 hypothetical protein ASE17_10085 [Phenylobacterium sp. Root77]